MGAIPEFALEVALVLEQSQDYAFASAEFRGHWEASPGRAVEVNPHMSLDLTGKEVRTLITLLEERLQALRNEVIHTSTNDYRKMLRERERELQCLHDKLVTLDALNVA